MAAGARVSSVLAALAAIAAAVAVTLPAAADAAPAQKCPSRGLGPAVQSVTARDTSCATAHRVVAAWRRQLSRPHTTCVPADGSTRPGVCTADGWRCTSDHTVNGHTYPVVCQGHPARRQVRIVLKV